MNSEIVAMEAFFTTNKKIITTEEKKKTDSAIIIQKHFRGYLTRKYI